MSMRDAPEPTPAEVDRVVGQALRVRKRVKEKSGPHAVADCPYCGKAEHLYVNLETGGWDCKRCNESGGLWKLATHLGIRVREEPRLVRTVGTAVMAAAKAKAVRVIENVRGVDLAGVQRGCDRLWIEGDKHGAMVLGYLRGRGLADETIRRFRLGVTAIREKDVPPELAVAIPYVEGDKVPLVKMRNLEKDKDRRKFRRTRGGYSGLFNADGIKGCRQVVLVEGELDAISLWQLGIHNVASTSLGAKKTIPEEWAETLADADDIVLWYDDDDAGQESAAALSDQIGSYRCRIARMPAGVEAKDANDLLRQLGDEAAATAKLVIERAVGITRADVVTPGTFSEVLESEIMGGEKTLGVSTGWPCVDRLLRGVRIGEMTMVTGHTNHGKTTWTMNLLRNLAKQGHPAMSSALENGPIAVARKVFQQDFGRPISSIKTDSDRTEAMACLRQIDRDPFFLLDMYGRHPIDRILDAFSYARHRLGVRYFALDHLHFLGKADPRQETLDHLDESLAKVVSATRELGIHVFLIAHPRGNIGQDVIPDGDTIKGCSSAKQGADNGLTVFRSMDPSGDSVKKKIKIKDAMGRRLETELGSKDVLIQAWKARHDEATEGTAILEFDRRNLRYTSKDPSLTGSAAAGAAKDGSNGPAQADWTQRATGEDPFDTWAANDR